MSIPAIPKDYYGHKTELFLDNLCNQETDNLGDQKQYSQEGLRKILFFVFWKPECNKDTEFFSQIGDSGKKLNTVLFLFIEKIMQENIMYL